MVAKRQGVVRSHSQSRSRQPPEGSAVASPSFPLFKGDYFQEEACRPIRVANIVPPWTRGDFRGVLVDRILCVATSSQKTDSPPPAFLEDEHDDEYDSKKDLQ